MEEEKLIEAIRSFPCLWQISNRFYRDQRARENAWKQVAHEVREWVDIRSCILTIFLIIQEMEFHYVA